MVKKSDKRPDVLENVLETLTDLESQKVEVNIPLSVEDYVLMEPKVVAFGGCPVTVKKGTIFRSDAYNIQSLRRKGYMLERISK